MSTAQVFQATRAALDNSVDQTAFQQQFDPSAINATGLDVTDIASQLSQIAGQNKLTGEDLAKGAQYYNDNMGGNFGQNARWWGPAAKLRAVVQGYNGVDPSFDWLRYTNSAVENEQQDILGKQLMAQQQRNGGGGFFSDLLGSFGQLAPLIGIGSMLMGGFDLSSLLSGLGGEAAGTGIYAASGLGASSPVWSAAVPGAAGWAAATPSMFGEALSGLGSSGWNSGFDLPGGGDMLDVVGSDWSGGGATGPTSGAAASSNPMLQIQHMMNMNPWIKNALGGLKGAMGNQQNPLAGALMGYANSMMPGTGGPFSNALGMGSGVLSMFQGADQNRRMKSAYNELNSMGDPMAALRQQGMSRLAALNSDPGGALGNTPGYKAGMDAITRQRAAMGQLGSGNLATALLDYGGNIFNQERGNAMNQIAMAGDPTRLAMMKAQLAGQTGAGNSQIMNGLATLGFGLNRMGL